MKYNNPDYTVESFKNEKYFSQKNVSSQTSWSSQRVDMLSCEKRKKGRGHTRNSVVMSRS